MMENKKYNVFWSKEIVRKASFSTVREAESLVETLLCDSDTTSLATDFAKHTKAPEQTTPNTTPKAPTPKRSRKAKGAPKRKRRKRNPVTGELMELPKEA